MEEKLQISILYLLAMILVGFVGLPLAFSFLASSYTIPSSGFIVKPSSLLSEYSEIRGVFMHAMNTVYPNWDQVAQTCDDYGINVIAVEALGNNWARYPSNVIPHWDYDLLTPALAACHSRDIKLYVAMNIMMSAYEGDGQDRSARDQNLNKVNWLCPTKSASRTLLKAIVEELAREYDFDGFMFDYIRYDTRDMCYCQECRSRFEREMNLTVANWPQDVRDGAIYGKQFGEWRTTPVNDLVRDIRNWMLAIRPDLEFSAAVWSWEPNYPTYWRYWIGQDSTYWVKEGWLDWVSPMIYSDNLSWLESIASDFQQYQVAGPEGKIPLVPFLDTCVDTVSSPTNFKDRVQKLRQLGADGYFIWRYGGPGDGQGSTSPDITQYLSNLNYNLTTSTRDLSLHLSSDSVTVTWITETLARSVVEYSTSSLFNATFKRDPRTGFDYWDIDHLAGILVESSEYLTYHSVTLEGLTKGQTYYLRVHSICNSGIATSRVLSFEL